MRRRFQHPVSSIFLPYTAYENGTEHSETPAHKIQTPGIRPKEEYNIQNTAEV